MPAASFARTKIQPPRQRAGLVGRARLAVPLAAALQEQRVVLLSAPAGFGKTVLLTQQLAALPAGTALAWVGADDADDLPRFAACLVAALDPHDLPWRVLPDALIDELGRPQGTAAFAAELLNALAGTDVTRGLVVVDDVHRLEDAALFDFLERLIERLPSHWGIVLSGRVDPPLPLARWRARGELAEWRQDDLLFTAAEVAALAGGRADGTALHERTGGWAAGLGLLLGAAAPAGATQRVDRHVFDYLASEVLDGMPGDLRLFLLRCSVLPELQAARCAAVAGDALAAQRLEEIQRRGLFFSLLDEPEPTLRLHDLFRDCLAERLRRDHAAELPALLARAAADEPDPLRRIGFLARGGLWDEAEGVLDELAPELLAAGRVPQVLRLLSQFTPARREASARLQRVQALAAWGHWDWLGVRPAALRAATLFGAAGDAAAARHAEALALMPMVIGGDPRAGALMERLRADLERQDTPTRALVASAEAWHAIGECRLDAVAPAMQRVVRLLEAQAGATLWLQCVPLTAYLGLPGMRPVLLQWVAGARRAAAADAAAGLRVLVQAIEAGLELFAGRAEAALALLETADDECRWLHRPPTQSTYVSTVAAFAHALHGASAPALAAAQALIDGLDDERSSGRRTTWLNHFLYLRLRVAAVLDDAQTQREMAERLRASVLPGEREVFLRQRGALAARLAALDGRWRAAAEGFEAALADELALDHYGQALELRARAAHAWCRVGDLDAAAAVLAPALARVRREGEPGPLAFAGPAAVAVLAGADWQQRLDADDRALLRSLVRTASAAPASSTAADGPLSAREWSVLERIAAGDSNKLIARALDLSPHTVKRHVANILDKLDLGSRGHAAAWWRDHR